MHSENKPYQSTPTSKIPADGLKGLKENGFGDLISGFTIFLIALPLSVGIALASGAPPTAGILAAIVGGILGSLLGGSYLTINGPAAGLIVIVAGAIQDLGQGDAISGFKRMLATVVVAGALQILFGVLRFGILGVGVPGSVIHGMLTAIGVIIMAKQFHIALGVVPDGKDIISLITEIPRSIQHLNPEVALIAAVAFIIILSFKSAKGSWTRYAPAPLAVVIVSIGLGHLFDFEHAHLVTSHWLSLEVGPKLLLNLPQNLASALVLPDFSMIFSVTSVRYIVMLALVGSIESLLSANAVDRMDHYKRTSNLDKELMSKGLCNMVSGMIGGLPIIAEMVRSSANIRNGARTRWSNFFHACFILSFLIFFPSILHEIPMAALAAILISVGYSLANPVQFLQTARVGRDHFAAFITTFVVTIFSDLLIGVFAGLLVEVIFNLARGAGIRNLFRVDAEENHHDSQVTIKVNSPLTFTNYLSLKKRIETLGEKGALVLDLSASSVVDHTSLDGLSRFQNDKNGKLVRVDFSEHHRAVSRHPLAARKRNKKTR